MVAGLLGDLLAELLIFLYAVITSFVPLSCSFIGLLREVLLEFIVRAQFVATVAFPFPFLLQRAALILAKSTSAGIFFRKPLVRGKCPAGLEVETRIALSALVTTAHTLPAAGELTLLDLIFRKIVHILPGAATSAEEFTLFFPILLAGATVEALLVPLRGAEILLVQQLLAICAAGLWRMLFLDRAPVYEFSTQFLQQQGRAF